ncbi:MAG: hypothetical protein DMG13_07385 [Acidobacteria bacterium]|nr:MAG: hypothetical protein DMG13_07385 [Acidobacteriota bacterium]
MFRINARKGLLGSIVALLVAITAPLQAQWLNYPTAGVPKTPTGSPDLNAPTPRTPDGKPDLSGVWDIEHNRPCPPGGCADMFIGHEFLNIGWGIKGGLPYQPWAAAIVKERTEQNGKDDPTTHCLPGGPVKIHTTPLLSKFIQIPGLLVILNERDASYRQIFTDHRPLPTIDLPSFNGFSSGKWDGDTLVVETTGFKDGMWLDRNGSPMTDAAKVTERFRRVNYGKMEIEITVDDPKAYTAPWTIKLNHFIVLDTELLDYICLENEKDIPRLLGK